MKKGVIVIFCLATTFAVSAPTPPQADKPPVRPVRAVDADLLEDARWVASKYGCHIDIAYLVAQESRRSGVPLRLLAALIYTESRFIIDARSPVNQNGTRDYGLMQLNSANYALFKVYVGGKEYNMSNPACNVHIGAAYLAELYAMFGNWTQAIAAYNAGAYAARNKRVPKSTLEYIKRVLTI